MAGRDARLFRRRPRRFVFTLSADQADKNGTAAGTSIHLPFALCKIWFVKMRAPVYIMCAALVAVVRSEETFYGGQSAGGEPPAGAPAPPLYSSEDQETLGYLVPRLMSRYRPNGREWAPYYAMPIEVDTNDIDSQLAGQEGRSKRHENKLMSPSLSITNSLDVLRNRLLLEISRKKAQLGMKSNRNLLCKIGKRALFDSKRNCDEPEKYIDDKLII